MHLCSGRISRVVAAGAATLIAAAGVAVSGGAAAPATAASTSSATSTPFCAPATLRTKSCFGLSLNPSLRRQVQARVGAAVRPYVESSQGGYAPQDLQAAYGLGSVVGTNGTGQTIAIVDAYDDPKAASDLAAYRSFFGLPACAAGTSSSSCLRKVDQSGGQSYPAADSGWSQEISLDLDAVSTACPLCHIILVEASSSNDNDLISGIREASSLGASVISLSFGGCEGGAGTGDFDPALQSANVPITVATGDSGYNSADNQSCWALNTPQYPASSPFVTAVGGTSLAKSGNTRGWAETAWAYINTPFGPEGGGSGCSGFETKPAWQTDTGCSNRTVADISADADPQTGISVYNTYSDTGWSVYGGTSLSAPLIAGIDALANSPAAAVDGKIWYSGVRTNDVTSGSNAPLATDCSPAYLCNARPGYDGPTGMGTPNGPPMAHVAMTPLSSISASTAVPISWTPPANVQPKTYRVWERDRSFGTGAWVPYDTTAGTTAATTFYGFRAHTYDFAVQYFLPTGSTDGPTGTVATTTTISGSATLAMNYMSMYAVDGYGTLHPASSPPLPNTASWPGWNIARGLALDGDGLGGQVLDGFGGLHAFGNAPALNSGGYWPNWDIARDIVVRSDGAGGYVLDGFGGMHPFGNAPAVNLTAYWGGWDIARGVAIFPSGTGAGTGGVVLDGFGGVHPFTVGSNPMPATATVTAYWPGWDIARSVVLLPGSSATSYSGYVLDGFGGLHSFAGGRASMPPTPSFTAYWPGWDIARSVLMVPGSSTNGYVVDGYGGFHFFGSSPPASPMITPNYGTNAPLVRGAAAV
jgi:hypothetical protein